MSFWCLNAFVVVEKAGEWPNFTESGSCWNGRQARCRPRIYLKENVYSLAMLTQSCVQCRIEYLLMLNLKLSHSGKARLSAV